MNYILVSLLVLSTAEAQNPSEEPRTWAPSGFHRQPPKAIPAKGCQNYMSCLACCKAESSPIITPECPASPESVDEKTCIGRCSSARNDSCTPLQSLKTNFSDQPQSSTSHPTTPGNILEATFLLGTIVFFAS
ncbi:hypothetical protein DSO57_1020878 [Entomophthora muscae]|uniref:Uncharacterized protein n=1 Tax=Entomophthora muscae TaxID=34485 RepID=A0ACC2S5X0_9FUNG|nr:hypothetical protein DSO57_1020878 [Entomophthora muscae]